MCADEIYMGGQEHFYIETQGMIAVPKGENDEMDLFMATQHAAFNQVGDTFKRHCLPLFTSWTLFD